MEGLKILNEINVSRYSATVILISIFIITMVVILAIIGLKEEDCGHSIFFTVIALLMIFAMMTGIKEDRDNPQKVLKVTPIEDKYFIDITKYEVIDIEGEIITLKEIVEE